MATIKPGVNVSLRANLRLSAICLPFLLFALLFQGCKGGRVAVESSAMKSVGYDAAAQVLEIEFPNGSVYRYLAVPPEIHTSLMSAPSKGRYFHANIKDKFRAEKAP